MSARLSTSRTAVIGLGGMGLRHCQAVQSVSGSSISAVCDLRPSAVEKAVSAYPGCEGYTDWTELIQRDRPDLLVIATNGPSHFEIARTAMEMGVKRLLIEKPLATSLRDAKDLIGLAEQKGVRVAVNHSRRWTPAYIRLRDVLRGGLIGEPKHFSFSLGGGQLACLASHIFDLVRFLTGLNAVRALGYLDQTGTPNPRGAQFLDPGGYGLAWFDQGMRLLFENSEDIGNRLHFCIIGTKGRIYVDEGAGDWQVWARNPRDKELPMTRHPALERHEFTPGTVDMIACAAAAQAELLGDGTITCSAADGLASLELVVAMHVSHARGNLPVEVPLDVEFDSLTFSFT